MSLEYLKPDFEKIKVSMQVPESHSKCPDEKWDGIISGKSSYDIKDNIELISLLKENNLELFQNDLFSLAIRCLDVMAFFDKMEKSISKSSGQRQELIQVLGFLASHNSTDIKIDFKQRSENSSISIKHPNIIETIKRALVEDLFRNDTLTEFGFVQREEIQNLGKYLKLVIEVEKVENSHIKKFGRKRKHRPTERLIDFLQIYLQNYTHLKAEEGTQISRGQSTFIYKFLNTLDIIPDDFSWAEDNIRHILTKFRAKKAQKPQNMKEVDEEYEAYVETIKSIIKKHQLD